MSIIADITGLIRFANIAANRGNKPQQLRLSGYALCQLVRTRYPHVIKKTDTDEDILELFKDSYDPDCGYYVLKGVA